MCTGYHSVPPSKWNAALPRRSLLSERANSFRLEQLPVGEEVHVPGKKIMLTPFKRHGGQALGMYLRLNLDDCASLAIRAQGHAQPSKAQ